MSTDSSLRSSVVPKLTEVLPVGLRPIRKTKSIRDQVVERITDLIVSGELPAGTRLTELGMADMLGVSRVPVREAFLILQGDQWIDIQQSQGAKVHVPRPNEVEEIFQVRMALEADAAALAGEKSNDECAVLLQLAQDGKQLILSEHGDDIKELSNINEQFHEQLALASGNSILIKMIDLMNKKTKMYFTVNITTRRGVEAWDEHIAIAHAIMDGRCEDASRMTREHIHASWEHFQNLSNH